MGECCCSSARSVTGLNQAFLFPQDQNLSSYVLSHIKSSSFPQHTLVEISRKLWAGLLPSHAREQRCLMALGTSAAVRKAPGKSGVG